MTKIVVARGVFSFLPHCTQCQSKCCKENRVVASDPEYQKIIAAGHEDRFTHIDVLNTRFHVLDYVQGPCGYLNTASGECTIPDEKPGTCKTYPAVVTYDENTGDYIGIGFAEPECPAVAFLSAPRKLELRNAALANLKEIGHEMTCLVLNIYDNRDNITLLEEIGAKVTMTSNDKVRQLLLD